MKRLQIDTARKLELLHVQEMAFNPDAQGHAPFWQYMQSKHKKRTRDISESDIVYSSSLGGCDVARGTEIPPCIHVLHLLIT